MHLVTDGLVEVNTAAGFPTLTLNDGGVATYAGSADSEALEFDYTVASGQNTTDLAVTAVHLNGSTIDNFLTGSGPANLTGAVTEVHGDLQIDTTAPTAVMTLGTPALQPDGDTTLQYAVTFSEPVTGVDASGFSLTMTGASSATIASVTQGSDSAHYTVTVDVGASVGGGTVALDITGAKIKDLAGNGFGGGAFSSAGSPLGLGADPLSGTIADLNGDGIPDIVAANAASNSVSVLLGTGGGSFVAAAGSPFETGPAPNSVAVADVNGDGIPDIVVANASLVPQVGNNSVSVMLGTGNGTFVAATGSPFAVGSGPYSVAVADVNSDGKPDIVTADFRDDNVRACCSAPAAVPSAPPSAPRSPSARDRFPWRSRTSTATAGPISSLPTEEAMT